MSNILREAAQQALSRLDQIAVRFPEDTELREQLRMILAQPDDGEKPVEAWHSNRKVSVYADVVLRVWGPNIEAQMAEAPRTAQAVQDAFAWLYADDKAQPVAWIEHHKAGDNLNWDRVDHSYAKATPLYTSPQPPASTFEQFCKKYGLDPEQMDRGGGMWARVAIEDWQKASAQPPVEQGADVRDAETELNCAEEVLDAIAANLNMEETSFDCIGDYITAVVNEIRNPKGLGWSAGRLVNCQDCGSVNDSMNRQCRTCGYAFPVSNDQQGAELSDEQICEIAERFEASDPCSSFWKEFARAILAADRAARGGS